MTDVVIVVMGVVLVGVTVKLTFTSHRVGRLEERLAALEAEVGTGLAHEARTHGLPVDPAKDRTLRGRVAAMERVTSRLLERVLVPLARRRRERRQA